MKDLRKQNLFGLSFVWPEVLWLLFIDLRCKKDCLSEKSMMRAQTVSLYSSDDQPHACTFLVTWRKVTQKVVRFHSHRNIIPTIDNTIISPPSKQNIKNGPKLCKIVPHPNPAVSIASFISNSGSETSSWLARSWPFVSKSFLSCVFSSAASITNLKIDQFSNLH